MKSRSCGLVQRIGAADSATPRPDPSGGQASALHFLIPPSAISLQFGRIGRWRAGIEVDWRAHPGSGSGTCFRTNDDLGACGGSVDAPPRAIRPYRDAGRCWEAGDRELKSYLKMIHTPSTCCRPGCRPTQTAGARCHRMCVSVDSLIERPIRSEGGLGCLPSRANTFSF